MRSADNSFMKFDFGEDDPTLKLEMGVTYKDVGVGSLMWDAAVAFAIYQRSERAFKLPQNARVLELGAGLALPGIDLARQMGHTSHVTLTDARAGLVDLARSNIALTRKMEEAKMREMASMEAHPLEWGDDVDVEVGAWSGYDLVVGSDICYEEKSVPSLVALVAGLRASLTVIVGPSTRPSMKALARALRNVEGVTVEEQRLTLVCSSADEDADESDSRFHNAGIHSMLVVSPLSPRE